VDQIDGPTPGDAATQAPDINQPHGVVGAPDPSGFGSRGRIRRRTRFLRKARELAYRDLGGLVFNLHRFGQRNDELVLAKLNLLGQIDSELHTLQAALREREPITVLREAGITACPRCAAIHGSEDRFCPNCGLSLGRHPDLPIAGGPAAPTPAAAPAAAEASGAAGVSQPGAPAPAPQTATGVGRPPAPAGSGVTDAPREQLSQATAPFPAVPAAVPAAVAPSSPAQAPVAAKGTTEGGSQADVPADAPTVVGRSPAPPPRPAAQPEEEPEEPAPTPGAEPLPARAGGTAPGEDPVTEIVRPPARGS